METNFTIVNTNETSPVFGRIATFTWPALPFETLVNIRDALGLATGVPAQGLHVAMHRACEIVAAGYKSGHYKRFARKLRDNVVEIVQEVLIPAEDGEVKGQRETVARVVATGGVMKVTASGPDWDDTAALEAATKHELETVPSGQVGNWADAVVGHELGGMELANRGHSFHVLGKFADRFDRFMLAMNDASEGKSLVFVAKTVDNSPETLASLVGSMRRSLERASEAAYDQATKATTKRGVEAAARRLGSFREQLDKYSVLFGEEVKSFHSQLESAVESLTALEILKEYGGLS